MKPWSCLLLLALAAVPATAALDRSADAHQVRRDLDSPRYDARIGALRSLLYSGITDAALFDEIERRLVPLFDAVHARGDRNEGQEMAWHAKALASSGNPKYLPTLQRLVARGEGRASHSFRHVAQAPGLLAEFARYNPIINGEENARPGQSDIVTSIVNMLRSNELELRAEGIKRLRAGNHRELYGLLAEQLERDHRAAGSDDLAYVLTWHCRTLGESGDGQYRALLAKVGETAHLAAVRKHCGKWAAKM